MINSLELYNEALTFAKNNPNAAAMPVLKNYYLQLTTMTFYELTTRKTSPIVSTLCRVNNIDLPTKNFSLTSAQVSFNLYTSFDLFAIVYGLNVALSENLDSCLNVFEGNTNNIFRGISLSDESFQALLMNLSALDESLGKFRVVEKIIKVPVERRVEVPVEKIVERRVEVPVEKIIEVPTQQPTQIIPDEDETIFLQSLNALADNRNSADKKIINEIKQVQLSLQDELSTLQATLKKISEIRDGIDFKTLEEPIYQLVHLFDMINETAQRHPQEDAQKGYEKLIKRCKSFSRYVEQSLAMLGAQLINEVNIPLDTTKHKAINSARPSDSAKVSKILNVGLIYKGRILRKAEVEIVESVANQYAAIRKSFGR